MGYAARVDLERRFSVEEIANLEDNAEPGAVNEALSDADEEANSYVAVRYGLPLPSVPKPLKVAVCDIARFRLYKDRPTEEVKYRYEKALEWLKGVARGSILLTFDPPLTPGQEEVTTNPATPYGLRDTGEIFSDAVLAHMPTIGDVPLVQRLRVL